MASIVNAFDPHFKVSTSSSDSVTAVERQPLSSGTTLLVDRPEEAELNGTAQPGWFRLTLTVDLMWLKEVETVDHVMPRNADIRECLRGRYRDRFDTGRVLRLRFEDFDSKVRTVNLGNDVCAEQIEQEYGVCVERLCLTLTDDGAATAKSLNSLQLHWKGGLKSVFSRHLFNDAAFSPGRNRLIYTGFFYFGQAEVKRKQYLWLTECPDHRLRPKDWKLWNQISANLGKELFYMSRDLRDQSDPPTLIDYAMIVGGEWECFRLRVHLASSFPGIRGTGDLLGEVLGPDGEVRDTMACEKAMLFLPLKKNLCIVAPLVDLGGGGNVWLYVTHDCENMKTNAVPADLIDVLKGKGLDFDVNAEPETHFRGYVSAVVGKTPLHFGVLSKAEDKLDFGHLFAENEGICTKLGRHVFLVVERDLVTEATGGKRLQKMHEYLVQTSRLDGAAIDLKEGYALTALIVRGDHKKVKEKLLAKDARFFADGMLVLTKAKAKVQAYLLPRDMRQRIADALCSMESGALWKQFDFGGLGPKFDGQPRVAKLNGHPNVTGSSLYSLPKAAETPGEQAAAKNDVEKKAEIKDPGTTKVENKSVNGEANATSSKGKVSRTAKSGSAKASPGQVGGAVPKQNAVATSDARNSEKAAEKKEKNRNQKTAKKMGQQQSAEEKAKEEARRKKRAEEIRQLIRKDCNDLRTEFEKHLVAVASEHWELDPAFALHTCQKCGRTDFDMGSCGACRAVRYCGETCFKRDRKKHGKQCWQLRLGRREAGPPPWFDAAVEEAVSVAEKQMPTVAAAAAAVIK